MREERSYPGQIVFSRLLLALDRIRNTLQRVTSSGRFIPTVDGLRFIALLFVVLYHLNAFVVAKSPSLTLDEAKASYLYRVLACGGCGVQLFFVISGFIVGSPFAEYYLRGRLRPSLGKHYTKMLLRIGPPYVINLLFAFVLLLVVKHANASALLPHLAASLLYMHDFVFGEMSAINCVAWSLEVQVQFYLMAPFLAGLFAVRPIRLRRAVLGGLVLAWIAAKIAFPSVWKHTLGASIISYLDFFLAGFLLADVFVLTWSGKPAPSLRWDLIGLIAWAAIIAVHFHESAVQFLPLIIFVAFIGMFRGALLGRVVCLPWITTIGGMCYTIYLYEYFLISAIGRWTIGLSVGRNYWSHVLLQAALVVPPLLLASAVLFFLLEKPFMMRDWPARCRIALQAAWKSA